MSKFKVGDRVIIRRKYDSIPRLSWMNSMDSAVGIETAVTEIHSDGDLRIQAGGKMRFAPEWLERLPSLALTKAIAKAEADLAKLKERAVAKAKQAADRKAKAERAKIMRGLSAAGRRVVAMLQSGSASDFGCQRENVIKLVSAITGDDPEKIKKALP